MDAIVADPDDDAARLVWADREGGERGELVVLQCQLARRDLPRGDRHRLRARERELLPRIERSTNLDGLGQGTFSRGFIECVQLDIATLAARAAELFERAPLVRTLLLAETYLEVHRFDGPTPDEAWQAHATVLAGALAGLPTGRIRALSAGP